LLVSRARRRLARRYQQTEAGSCWYLDPGGKGLARLDRRGQDVLLAFGEDLREEPFVKMLLLAAALQW
jgi:hypothetical protein